MSETTDYINDIENPEENGQIQPESISEPTAKQESDWLEEKKQEEEEQEEQQAEEEEQEEGEVIVVEEEISETLITEEVF